MVSSLSRSIGKPARPDDMSDTPNPNVGPPEPRVERPRARRVDRLDAALLKSAWRQSNQMEAGGAWRPRCPSLRGHRHDSLARLRPARSATSAPDYSKMMR